MLLFAQSEGISINDMNIKKCSIVRKFLASSTDKLPTSAHSSDGEIPHTHAHAQFFFADVPEVCECVECRIYLIQPRTQ